MNKPTTKIVNLSHVMVNTDENYQRENTAKEYDLPSMMQQIVDVGRIVKPPVVEDVNGELHVRQGHRRVGAAHRLLADPTISVELKENLSKTMVIVYKDLSEAERMTLVLDDGGQKQISRWGIINSVWKMDKQFFSEAQIINTMYFSLARYTRNEQKLKTLSADPKVREGELKKWLHGTVGNYILSAAKMGPLVREQFLLTAKAEDGSLEEGEKVRIKMSRDRITALSAAKNGEKDIWTPDNGSPAFNELLEKFAREDAGDPKEKLTRPTTKELKDKADAFFSPLIRKSLLLAAGETGDKVKGLAEDDDEYKRIAENFRIVRELLADIRKTDPIAANLIGAIVNGTATEVKNHFESFVGSGK